MSGVKLGNNLWEHTLFNNRLQPIEIGLGTTQNGVNRLKLTYSYGTTTNNGNVLTQTITVPTIGAATGFTATQSYTYDQLNRLKVAQENSGASWKQIFVYDRYGNRNFDVANTTNGFVSSNLTVNQANNRYSAGQGSILYDAAGNLTRDYNGHTFGYDGENRQVNYDGGATIAGGASYSYDGDGRRVKKVDGGSLVTTIFVYNALGQMVAEYDNSGQQSAGGTSYLTADMLGTPRVITDSNGAVKARHDYLPFGEEIGLVGGRTSQQGYVADDVRQKFTGKERDNETGLDYFGARYYSASMGRFTSVDPLAASANVSDPQSWNRYTYANNNPLKYVDPEGLKKEPVFQAYEDIYDDQRRILENSSITVGKGDNKQTLSGQALYDHLAKNDPKALANFLNQTSALMNFQVMMKDGDGHPAFTTGAALVNSVTSISQDRIIANVNPMLKDAVEIASLAPKGFNGLYSGPENSSGEHGDFDVSFRQRMDNGPQQLSFNSKNGFRSADIDIDYYLNRGAGGRAKHILLEGLPNTVFKTRTDPYKVFEIIQQNPKIAIKPNYRLEKR